MKFRFLSLTILSICFSFTLFPQIYSGLSFPYPHLKVNDAPFLIYGGELGNSSASCEDDMRLIFPRLRMMNLNTVLIPAYWDLLEPEEGSYDFSLTDKAIDIARENNLKVVFLWFGAWKNSMSCYAPAWVKRDYVRFPRAKTSSGKPLEIISVFSDNLKKADLNAFEKWIEHIKNYDKDETVVMIQVENEIGMLEDARDHSHLAQEIYEEGVPDALMKYLIENKEKLHPALIEKWEKNGFISKGSWKEVFGDDLFTDEYFMAWYYAKYVEELAKRGKKVISLPLYVNAAMNSRGRLPGEYPSAGPLAHLKDIWHAAAPDIDFLSPDIYDPGFEDWVEAYALSDNILFIPETRRSPDNGPQAYYVMGHHRALGISPFSIENSSDKEEASISAAYSILNQLTPLITQISDNTFIDGFLLSKENPSTIIHDDSTRITISHFLTLPWDPRANDGSEWPLTGGLILKTGPDEYIVAGTGIVLKFENEEEIGNELKLGEDGFLESGDERNDKNNYATTSRKGLLSVEEVRINADGTFSRLRSFNGDETHQGRHARISVDDNKILRIKTYTYK